MTKKILRDYIGRQVRNVTNVEEGYKLDFYDYVFLVPKDFPLYLEYYTGVFNAPVEHESLDKGPIHESIYRQSHDCNN